MISGDQPRYCFRFVGGISADGVVHRTCRSQRGFDVDEKTDFIRYCVDDIAIPTSLARGLSLIEADFLDVMVAIYIADREAPRKGGQRMMHVVVPVRCPEVWEREDVGSTLRASAEFAASEYWTFDFVPRVNSRRASEVQLTLPFSGSTQVGRVLLHSGGVDSVAGSAASLQAAWPGVMLLASVKTHPRTFQVATGTAESIRRLPGGRRVGPVIPLGVGISRDGRPKDDREKTQRTRSLLYLAYGTVLASIAGLSQLHVFENGIGAINLSMTADHFGFRVSRAMHPRTLSLMSDLATLVLDRSFSIQNLGLWMTKGEAISTLVNSPYASVLSETLSCDRAVYLSPKCACGKCTSCLLRRVGFAALGPGSAGLDVVAYQFDPYSRERIWKEHDVRALAAMEFQARRMRQALESLKPFRAFASEFPEIYRVVNEEAFLAMSLENVKSAIVRLYTQYVWEFSVFLQSIERARIKRIDTPSVETRGFSASTAS
jgi:hypothetical protein